MSKQILGVTDPDKYDLFHKYASETKLFVRQEADDWFVLRML